MKLYLLKLFLIFGTSFVVLGCTTPQPVLYPNEQTKLVGDQQVRKDIDECTQLAKDSGAKMTGAEDIAKDTAGSATEGAATGAVTGNAGTSAAVGAISRGMNRFFLGLRDAIKALAPHTKQWSKDV